MGTELHTSQLYDACNVLFGPEVGVSVDFLRYLQMPGLKAVYRQKALETHPDRAIALALPPLALEARFKEINAAYRELHDYLENPLRFKLIDDRSHKGYPRSRTQTKKTDSSTECFSSRFFKGMVPKRALLFGQYVYYHGCISYRQLIDAIVWQKIRRPLLGSIAVRWGWLDEDEVRQILGQRRRGEKFGETALRGGYLTSNELHVILGRQRMLQPRIGKYFVDKRIFPVSVVETMVAGLRRHNRQYRSR